MKKFKNKKSTCQTSVCDVHACHLPYLLLTLDYRHCVCAGNVLYDESAPVEPQQCSTPAQGSTPIDNLLDASVDAAWFASPDFEKNYARVVSGLKQPRVDDPPGGCSFGTARERCAAFDNPVPVGKVAQGQEWPLFSDEPAPFPPPWPSASQRRAMQAESSHRHPEEPLGPLAQKWVDDLHKWYTRLQDHFNFNPADLPSNLRANVGKWRKRLAFLKQDHPLLYEAIIANITTGHKIPFNSKPKKFFRRRNPPSLHLDRHRAWAAIRKDMAHGALKPVDLKADGVPHCVCPVRTAEKNDGSARFVHNSRRVNKCVSPEETKCKLETLLKARNIFIQGGFAVGLDFSSGYHCIAMNDDDRKFLAFALDEHELPDGAAAWLHKHFPNSYHQGRRCFVFEYIALPFGLSSSCRTFNDLVTALLAFWRRCPIDGRPTRVSSYIDDVLGVTEHFDSAMRLSILMVFEAASLGLSLKIPKCSFFPRHAIRALGTVVDLAAFKFSVTRSRAEKIRAARKKLRKAVNDNPEAVPAKLVASFIGLIWSIATCCHRAASVMVRAITATLTAGLRSCINIFDLPLSWIMNRFWSGTVRWSPDADRQLSFWEKVRFRGLSAPISADVLGMSVERSFWYPADYNSDEVSFLFQDASESASGGGAMRVVDGALRPSGRLFLAEFLRLQRTLSSTLREILGIWWCLQATAETTGHRIVFICDNWSACRAVLRGSRVRAIQEVAEAIFLWCLAHNKVCWPVWVPRSHRLIGEADRRSRLSIPHDSRSPQAVVDAANDMAMRLWGRCLSFDQAASHRSAVKVHGRVLPFNAFCFQPGAAGIDMFRCLASWRHNINYVFPPQPMSGRLLSFLPTTMSRAVVALRLPLPNAWWSYTIQPHSPGLLSSRRLLGFKIFAFDFSAPNRPGFVVQALSRQGIGVMRHALPVQRSLDESNTRPT